jgi:hypothetical protein
MVTNEGILSEVNHTFKKLGFLWQQESARLHSPLRTTWKSCIQFLSGPIEHMLVPLENQISGLTFKNEMGRCSCQIHPRPLRVILSKITGICRSSRPHCE